LEVLVDLQKVGLGKIEGELDGVRVGAMVPLQAIIDHEDAGAIAGGLLSTAAGYTQSRNLREQGTLGGTLITASPEDPLTTALLVLDAEVRYADPGLHTAPFASFVAYRDRLLKTRALLVDIYVKRPPARSMGAFEVVGRSPKDKPIVCAAAYVAVEEGLPVELRIAVGGAHLRPTRLLKTEHILKGQEQLLTPEKIDAALEPALAELEPVEDFRGSTTYRLEMGKVLARRAILAAWEKARRL
jgi:CO/xanthine dehydrogenase FAD-binding subunit